ncbi:MAG: DUF6056 family protein [Lachnospiraceae bacterium]
MKKFVEKINERHIYILLLAIFLLSLIPVLMLGFYGYPSADDFSASDSVRDAWMNTGSFWEVIKAALGNGTFNYLNWSGVFASVFWTSLQPGIFGEQFYGMTTVITIVLLLVGGFYLGHVIREKYLKADKYVFGIITILYLFTIIQMMPSGNEGLYWHAGVVNYTWAFAFLMMLLGVVLSLYREKQKGKRSLKCLLACILAILVGGGNFITALQGCLWMGLAVFLICAVDYSRGGLSSWEVIKKNLSVIMPSIIAVASFIASVMAPGNAIRMEQSEGMNPIKAIFVSFYYCLNEPVESWLRWPAIALLVLSLPFMWRAASGMEYSFRYPGLVALMAYCLVSAGFTPNLYAQGELGAGRLHNTIYFIFIFALYILVFYTVGWLNKRYMAEKSVKNEFSQTSRTFICGMLVFLIIASGLHVKADERLYIGAEATVALVSGQAEIYRQENEERLKLLKDESLKNVTVKAFSDPPRLLLFHDVSFDSGDWFNFVVAKYYGKESVVCEE